MVGRRSIVGVVSPSMPTRMPTAVASDGTLVAAPMAVTADRRMEGVMSMVSVMVEDSDRAWGAETDGIHEAPRVPTVQHIGVVSLCWSVNVDYRWRGEFTDLELNLLHAEGFHHRRLDDAWRAQVERYSLGWVTARDDQGLVGFVNVPWDGMVHAFVLDTLVAERARRQGIGKRLVAICAEEARAAGCEWLHVDFEDEHTAFYLESCGFTPTRAGLLALAAG